MEKKNYFATLKKIRERYKWLKPGDYEPYLVCQNWERIMSPIERIVWSDLRYHGLRFYPQYPAGIYFIDFADPETMIGIEVDGKAYHQDQEKDEQRQQELEKMGWTIVRIAGFETVEKHEFYIHRILEAMGYKCQMPRFAEEDDCGRQWDLDEVFEE
jgi:very-short-patch-repair endonuclease